MTVPKLFRPADLGNDPKWLECNPAFREVEINWTKPELWGPKDQKPPIDAAERKPGYLYAMTWEHHAASRREHIAYIGITDKLTTRFTNHPTAKYLVERTRKTFLSIGHIDFGRWKTASARTRQITEELEHILIWALWSELENLSKMSCLPGYGKNGGDPWHITNTGHSFAGRMPREIIYPWILVKPRRDRSLKSRNASAS